MLPQLKLRLAGNERILFIVFAVLGIGLLLSAGYVYATPPVEQPDPREFDNRTERPEQPDEVVVTSAKYPEEVFSINASLIDGAFVNNRSSLYDEGVFLTRHEWADLPGRYSRNKRTIEGGYFKSYSPDLSFILRVDSSDDVTINLLDVELKRQREVGAGGGQVFSKNQTLLSRVSTTVDDEISYDKEFNVTRKFEMEDEDLRERFPTGVSVSTSLIATVRYETESINGPVEKTSYSGTLRIPNGSTVRYSPGGGVYLVTGGESARSSGKIEYQYPTDSFIEVSDTTITQTAISEQTEEELNISDHNITSTALSEIEKDYFNRTSQTYEFTTLSNATKQEIRETLGIPAPSARPTTPPEPPEPQVGEPNMQLVGLLSLLGILTIGVGAIIAAKVPEFDEEKLRTELAHNEYSEWISEGELVLDADNKYVHVDSIEDLVNVAIDTDKRVIHDSDLSVYTVTDGAVIYYYTNELSDFQRWTNL
jgi:hypothetical protein